MASSSATRDLGLRALGEVLHGELPGSDLVAAHDDGGAGAELVGAFHHRLQAGRSVLDLDADAARPQAVGDGQHEGHRFRVQRSEEHADGGLVALGRIGDGQQRALEAEGEADGRHGRTAQRRHQAIVTPAARHGVLGAEVTGVALDLEDRRRVVVEPAHQARVHAMGNAEPRQRARARDRTGPGRRHRATRGGQGPPRSRR